MLTKEQYKFLKDFIKACKRNKKKDNLLKHFNREKITVDKLKELLICHTSLFPTEPYNEVEASDTLTGNLLIQSIEIYLEEIGLNDCICYYSPKYYGITKIGLEKMNAYKEERAKVYISKRANIIAIVSVIIAAVSLVISIIALKS